MPQKAVFIILLLLLCQHVSNAEYFMTEEDSNLLIKIAEEKFLFWSAAILLMTVVHYTVKYFDCPISSGVFLMCFGMIWGIASLYSGWMYHIAKSAQTNSFLKGLRDTYHPILIFSTMFSLDTHTFAKCWVQIIIISGPVTAISGILTGVMMRVVSDAVWTKLVAIIFGIILSCYYPMEVLKWLNESNVKTKYLASLLHGECVLGSLVAINMQTYIHGHINGWLMHWYQYTCIVLRNIIMGSIVGYLFGTIGICMTKFVYRKSCLLMLFTLCSAYNSYFFGSWIGDAGILSCMIAGLMMARERTSLPTDIQENVDQLWNMFSYVFLGVIVITITIRVPSLISADMNVKEYILVFVTYLVSNVTRFLSFALFSPILCRTGYGMTFKNMIVCVWCGIKSPICLILAVEMYDTMKQEKFLHIYGVYFLSLLINGSFVPVLMRALGMTDISTTRQTNMNNCMKFIYDARARTISILKMDRSLADASWPLVITTTALKHPYRKFNILDDANKETDEDFIFGFRFTFCPDCEKHIPTEPTRKEIKEMTKEAKLRLLKMRKCIYSRLYETGLLNRRSLRILHQTIEYASDTDFATVDIQNLLNMFLKENKTLKYIQTQLNRLFSVNTEKNKKFKKWWNRWSYIITTHWAFYILMAVLVLYSTTLHFYKILSAVNETFRTVVFISNFILLGAFLFEFVISILGASSMILIAVPTYFKSCTNVVEFLVLCCTFCETILYSFDFLQDSYFYLEVITTCFLMLRILGLFCYLKRSSCTISIMNSISMYMDQEINIYKSLALHMAINYIFTETEILQNLDQIVDNEKVNNRIRHKIENDRLELSKKVAHFHKLQPWLTSILKSKSAIGAVLSSMKDELTELKFTGWVDDVEYNKLLTSLEQCYHYVSTIKFIEPCSPKLIFEGMSYLGDDQELIKFLYSNIASRKFDPGDVVFTQGEVVEGVYILITGTFVLTYTPNESVLRLLKEKGALPVMDFINGSKFDTAGTDFKIPGNSIGEFSILTDKNSDVQVTAETHSEALFLSFKVFKEAFMRDMDPVRGLECRMWKCCTFGVAVIVLLNVPAYRVFSYDKIVAKLERAFVPNLSNFKIFVVTSMMHDIILIHGIVMDFNTKDMYIAPCYIPRAVQKLILPRSSLYNVISPVEAKLMILPERDFDDYEIMIAEEQICTDEKHKVLHHSPFFEGDRVSTSIIEYVRTYKKKGTLNPAIS